MVAAISERAASLKSEAKAGLRDQGPYSARNSSKGALIEEAGKVCAALVSGHSIDEVRAKVLDGTLLAQRSRSNRDRIWSTLNWRYLITEPPWLLAQLQDAYRSGPHSVEFISLLYLLFALRDRLTFDFVTQVLANKGIQGRPLVSRNDVLDLLQGAAGVQSQIDRWSEKTRVKLAGSILTALRDFGVLQGQQKKTLVQPSLPLSTAETLLRILVTEGERGRAVLENPTWKLFLLSEHEVISALSRLAQTGRIRFEKVGTTVVLETPASWEETA